MTAVEIVREIGLIYRERNHQDLSELSVPKWFREELRRELMEDCSYTLAFSSFDRAFYDAYWDCGATQMVLFGIRIDEQAS